MKKNIVVCGASGSIGTQLVKVLQERGSDVCVISRSAKQSAQTLPSVREHASWSDRARCQTLINQSDALVNLSGANVGELRWTAQNKALFRSSRIDSTRHCVAMLHTAPQTKRRVLVSASAVGYYGFCGDEWKSETDSAGSDFLAQLCKDWEAESMQANDVCRVVNPRIGIVLDAKSGALGKLLLPFRMFVGGPLGSGQQWYSWIHRDDLISALVFCLDNEQLSGAVNCVAPQPLRMDDFTTCIARALHRPNIFRVPEFALKLLLGEQHTIVTKGQRVSSSKIEQNGFRFQFSDCQTCVNELLLSN